MTKNTELYKVGDIVVATKEASVFGMVGKIVGVFNYRTRESCYCIKTDKVQRPEGQIPSCAEDCPLKLCLKDNCINCWDFDNTLWKRVPKVIALLKGRIKDPHF